MIRSLQLQFSGPTGINFRYSYSFVGLTGIFLYSYSSVQLHKKWSMELFSENYSYSYIKNGFSNYKCNDFEKNGNSEKLEKAVTVDFKRHPAQKVTLSSRQVCLSQCPKS